MTVGEDRTALVAGVVPGLALPARDGGLAGILADLPAPGAAIGAETEMCQIEHRRFAGHSFQLTYL